MKYVKKLFVIEYIIYLFVNIDARINPNFINISHSLLFMIYIGLIIIEWLIISICQMTINISKKAKLGVICVFIIFLYIIQLISSFSSKIEIELSVMLILTTYFTGKMINKLKCMREILLVSFWTPTIFFIIICLKNDINIVTLFEKINFQYMFSTEYSKRLRVDFGFYNVNAAGNLSSCLLCIALLLLNFDVLYKRCVSRNLFYLAVAFDICILLLTGSRTAILSVLVCYSIVIGYKIWLFIKNRKTGQNILRTFYIGILAILCLYFFSRGFFTQYFIARKFAFDNLVFINTPKQRIFGLGLIPPGNFLNLVIDWQKGNFMDNYYVYVYVTTGLLGLTIIGCMLLYVGIELIRKSVRDNTYFAVFACYVACIIGGFAETSVLYHLFPSCAIYFSIFFAVLDHKSKKLNKKVALILGG